MPPSEPMRQDGYHGYDEVDEYIEARRAERARRSAATTAYPRRDERRLEEAGGRRAAEVRRYPADDAYARRPSGRTLRAVDSWLEPDHEVASDRLDADQHPHASERPLDPERPIASDRPDAPELGARRTVVITGRGAERYAQPRRTYSSGLRPHERAGFRPDRLAMWAFLLALVLLLVAVTSSHAAVLAVLPH